MGLFDSVLEFFSGKPKTKNQKPLIVEEEPKTNENDDSFSEDIHEELKRLENMQGDSELPKALQDEYKYTENFEAFDEYSAMHRDHQTGSLNALVGCDKGQVTIPTGTGKTRIQVSVHVQDMIEKSKNNNSGVYVISAHRLALCTQLLEDMIEVAVMCGLNFDLLYIGSERFNDDKVHFHYKSKGFTKYVANTTNTTSKQEVARAVQTAKANNRHLLVVSTYHSFHKLEYVDKIDICTYDEAHISIQDRFMENIELIKPKIEREYFFTATRKVWGEELGMNNTEFFGDVVYEKSPKEMVEKGEIVPPRIHSINIDNEDEYSSSDLENESMLYKVVTEGFLEHRGVVKKHSATPENLGAKLLVTFKGSKDMFELHNDQKFRRWCGENNIKVFAVSSTRGDAYNFESMRRNKVIDKMDELSDEEDAILFHIDILTEGIDLPSITGVLPFRDLSKSKLLQTIGRGARLLSTDRKRLYTGEIQPQEYDKMVKPYCWVLLSEDIFVDHEQKERVENILYTISNDYGIPLEELTVGDTFKGENEDELDSVTDKDRTDSHDKECGLLHTINRMMCKSFSDDIKLEADPIEYVFNEIQSIDYSKCKFMFKIDNDTFNTNTLVDMVLTLAKHIGLDLLYKSNFSYRTISVDNVGKVIIPAIATKDDGVYHTATSQIKSIYTPISDSKYHLSTNFSKDRAVAICNKMAKHFGCNFQIV